MNASNRPGRARTLLALGLFLTTLSFGHAMAAEPRTLRVDGRVVNSLPRYVECRFAMQEGARTPAAPAPGAALIDILRWDLRTDCQRVWRTEEYVDGCRVWCEWEGEVYTRVFDQKPAETAPLRLSLH